MDQEFPLADELRPVRLQLELLKLDRVQQELVLLRLLMYLFQIIGSEPSTLAVWPHCSVVWRQSR